MNIIYTAEFNENRALPVMVYANALCTYIQQLAPDHADDVAKVCINIKNSHEYFLRKSMETSQPNPENQIEVIQDNVADIADLKAENDRLNMKVRELESEKNEADGRIAELVGLVELNSTEASQVAANASILANGECEKNRTIAELRDFLQESSGGVWANANKTCRVLREIDAFEAKIKQLEFEKRRADAKIAKLGKLVDLKEASQLTAQGRLFANRKVDKNRDIDDMNEQIEKLHNNLRQMSERNNELQISKNSIEALNEAHIKKIKQMEAENTKLKEELKQKEEKLEMAYSKVEQVKEDNEQLNTEEHVHKEKA